MLFFVQQKYEVAVLNSDNKTNVSRNKSKSIQQNKMIYEGTYHFNISRILLFNVFLIK